MLGVIVVTMTLVTIPAVQGQGSYNVEFCRKLILSPSMVGSGVGSDPLPRSKVVTRQCDRKFTTNDGYIGVVLRLMDVRSDADVPVVRELLDPDQTSVWASQSSVPFPFSGGRWLEYSLWGVLPVTADEAALSAEDFSAAGIIRLQGKPVRERTGEWTLRVRLKGGPPQSFKFTLQAAP
jgi:hypothetical protein